MEYADLLILVFMIVFVHHLPEVSHAKYYVSVKQVL